MQLISTASTTWLCSIKPRLYLAKVMDILLTGDSHRHKHTQPGSALYHCWYVLAGQLKESLFNRLQCLQV